MEYLLCTRQDVKKFANMNANVQDYDDLIDATIRMWTLNAKTFCRRDFIYGEHTETFNVTLVGRVLTVKLKESPVIEDETHPVVIYCGTEKLPRGAFLVNNEKGLIRINNEYLYDGLDNLTITYTGGLSLDESDDEDEDIKVIEPCPLRSAIANQCAYSVLRTIQSNQGQTQTNTGSPTNLTTPASMGFLPEVSLVLANYRITLTGM